MKKPWRGIMKILEIQHLSETGELLYSEEKILNMLHADGEHLILSCMFTGELAPAQYYIGLDNRSSLAADDTLDTIIDSGEPSTNAYARQVVGSDDFSMIINSNGNYQANSPVISFRAIGGSWGPVKNIFLCNSANYDGILIGSASLSGSRTVTDGQIITLRMGMALRDCP